MIAIYGYKDGDYQLLDSPSTSVELSFRISDLRRPNVKTAPFSLTFEMPFSLVNNTFFGHQQEPSLQTSDFDLNKKTSGRLLDDQVPIMDGVIQVTSIDVSARVYKCRFFSETADFFDAIKGRAWSDVWRDTAGNVFCPLDHALTASNVQNTFTGTQPAGTTLPTSTIIYALTDVGIPLQQGLDYPAYYLGYWDTEVRFQNFRPCVNVPYLVDEILNYAGFTRDTANCFFSDTTYNSENLYMMCGLGSQSLPTRLAYGFSVQSLATQNTLTCGTDAAYGTSRITYWDAPPQAPFYDPDQQLSVIGWSAQVSQNVSFAFTFLTTAYTGTTPTPNFRATLSVLGGDALAIYTWEYEDSLTAPITWAPTVAVEAGQTVVLFMEATGQSGATQSVQVAITWAVTAFDVVGGDDATRIQFVDALGPGVDTFIQGLCDTYNLIINVSERTKEVSFQLYDEWLESGGGPIDWTDKVNAEGPMEIVPSTDYVPRTMKLTPAEGTDHRNGFYTRKFGVRKGAYRYQSRNDFATEDLVVGDKFTLLRNTQLKGLWTNYGTVNTNVNTPNIVISELWSSFDGDRVTYEGMPNALCYHHGSQDLTDNPIVVASSVTSAPLFTPYSGSGTDSNIFSLEYALSAPDFASSDVIGLAVNGLYDKFWYNYLQSLFSRDARVLKCQAYLSAIDINALDFSRYVNIQNVQYRIIAIDNYEVGTNGLCNLTLFKRADGFLYDCSLTPTVNADGRVTWQDGAGATTSPTELCCVSYGYTWNAGNNTCSVHNNRSVDIDSGDNGQDTGGGVVNRSSGGSMSLTGNAARTFFSELKSSITNERWEMSVASRFAVPAIAKTLVQQTTFQIPPQRVLTVKVDWLAVCTEGTNVGSSASGEEEFLLTTIDSNTSKASGSLYARGLAGFNVDLVIVNSIGGSTFQVQCTGVAANEHDWFLDVSTTTYDTGALKTTQPFLVAAFQDNDTILFQDNDIMEFNEYS